MLIGTIMGGGVVSSVWGLSRLCQQNVGHRHHLQQPDPVARGWETIPQKQTGYFCELPNFKDWFRESAAFPKLCQTGTEFQYFPPVVQILMPGARSGERGERRSGSTGWGRLMAARL